MNRLRKPRPRPILRAATTPPAPDFATEYAPRADASQRVAAKQRAKAAPIAPLPTVRIAADAPILSRQYLSIAAGALLLVLAMIGLATYGVPQARPLQITPTPTMAATAAPAPAALSAPTAMLSPVQTINAYASPDGLLLGPIETTRPMTATAHFGATWIQADVARSGLVWLRVGDVPGLAISGPDLAPVAAAPVGQGLTLWRAPVVPPMPPIVPTDAPAADPVPTDVPIVEIGPDTPPDGEFGGPGSSSGGDWRAPTSIEVQ